MAIRRTAQAARGTRLETRAILARIERGPVDTYLEPSARDMTDRRPNVALIVAVSAGRDGNLPAGPGRPGILSRAPC